MRGSEQINVSCVIVRTRLREIDRANTEVQGVNIDNIREQLITIANSRTKRNGWRVGVTMKVKEVMIFFDDIYCIPINSFRKKEIVSPREDAKSH